MSKKINLYPFVLSLLLLCGILNSCQDKCTETRTYMKYSPVMKATEDVRNSFKLLPPQELQNPGKIYTFQNSLFIVDRGIGFHIVDNSDPSSPIYTDFVQVDGCMDVAVRNNILYSNQGPDVISINISGEPGIISRSKNMLNGGVEEDSIIVAWNKSEVVEIIEGDCNGSSQNWDNGNRGFSNSADENISFNGNSSSSQSINDSRTGNSSNGGSEGQSGSMSRFSIIGNNLYIVSDWDLLSYDIDAGMSLQSRTRIGNGIETVFGTDEYLYLGTTTGMIIYDRNQGGTPTFVSRLEHARGCDPVVVRGNFAFVTLRGNSSCGQAEDGLYVVNITDITNPTLHSMHPMISPYGLGVQNDVLMICDGPAGLRVFDIKDLNAISDSEIATDNSLNAYDVILNNGLAILSAEEGVFQYAFDGSGKLERLSTLIVK